MSLTLKILGQSSPSATTNTTLYTVPSATETAVSSISICNRGATNSTFRIAIRPNGATISNEHYLYYDLPLAANDTFICTCGITMDASDVVTVYSSNTSLSFQIFGQEKS